ncbi:MAG: 2-hydroxyglutaryl-CoA dehydratase [Verrucomicrobia bacterium]|nr:2-hydroxyglutaryl-CoA dehydratase [Verrucomicrobiota bacterium]MBU4247391.1 2-hydroxyglutaryl-CoA dehydratase [Verrucomicrobiota bacterium]MBU4292119.1 2-hydroxyglutaryl-CoA dehydratase [Verrucomicrobiota bacterium]MBU4498196.1 2-hydroxyglutaryl-CoA dehydratase [Verrucomicrobiota bacterium]MCG2681396.1 acyl-CoA dehydratase activase [Kiritimatiellia bacterium]
MIYAGIDAGSRAIKVVLINGRDRRVMGSGIADQGLKQEALASRLFDRVLKRAGVRRRGIRRIVATGWGRDAVTFADTTITEITCQACGVYREQGDAKTVVDIGGQDSKLIRLDTGGKVRDFVMSDRCAAGTGRFLEVVAARLEVPLGSLGELAGLATKPSAINSMCVVFAETEIIGLLASGEKPANIAAGVQASVSARIASMAGRNISEPVVFTGGVALVSGMTQALESALGYPVRVASRAQLTGALGAAILASRPE